MTNQQHLPDGYRGIHHHEYEGLRGEYELQCLDQDGDWQNMAFSHDPDALFALAWRVA